METAFRGLQKGRARAQAEFGVEMRWVFDIVRDIPDVAYRAQRADYTTRVALEGIVNLVQN
jgi:aminodeoxyfutalosine deaminase